MGCGKPTGHSAEEYLRKDHEQSDLTGCLATGSNCLANSKKSSEARGHNTCKDTGSCSIGLWDREAEGLRCSVCKQGPSQQMALGNHKSICSWSCCLQLYSNPPLTKTAQPWMQYTGKCNYSALTCAQGFLLQHNDAAALFVYILPLLLEDC